MGGSFPNLHRVQEVLEISGGSGRRKKQKKGTRIMLYK